MTLTALDPTPALVVIDLQAGIISRETHPRPAAECVARSAVLAEAFRAQGWPVVLVNVDAAPHGRTDRNPAGGGTAFPLEACVLAPELGEGVVVTKHTRGAFASTDLDAELRGRGVTQVFLTGIATAVGVEETGREAFARGYHVVVVEDACSDSEEGRHAHSVEHTLPTLAQVTTVSEVLSFVTAR